MKWRRRRDEEIDREIRNHLELEAQEHREAGLGHPEAESAARRAFGNVVLAQESTREAWGWPRFEALLRDFRYAARGLRKSPGFALTAILTLALGIGASTAVFTVVDSVVLKPLAFRESESLVAVWEHVRMIGGAPVGPNPRHVDHWRERVTAVQAFTVVRGSGTGLTIGNETSPRYAAAVYCLPNLFEVLKASAVLGRTFRPEDVRNNAVVLTHAGWQAFFHGASDVIGRTVRLDGTVSQIIGVLPPDFHFPNANVLREFQARQPKSGILEPSLFIPVEFNYGQMGWFGNWGNWATLARLAPGADVRGAENQLNAIQEQLWRSIPQRPNDDRPGAMRVSLQPMHDAMVGEYRIGLWLLMAAVGGLMLIACLNLANAQLGRALSRQRDAAVRTALGAARWRLIWQVLAENLLLAGAGGAAGVALAAAGLAAFRRSAMVDLPRLAEIRLDPTVLSFAIVLTIAASLLAGMLPAWRMISADPHGGVQQATARTHGSRAGHRTRAWLIGAQVFGCTVLLLVTGLFAKSLLHLLHQDKGFDTARTAVAEVRLAGPAYQKSESRAAFVDAVLSQLRSTPGVRQAAYVSAMPLEGESWIESVQRVDRPQQQGPLVNARWASPGYFETTRQRLVAGRFLEERDSDLPSVVISEGEARALWGQDDPIGGQVRLLGRTHTIIGVVADSLSASLKTAPVRLAYVPYRFRTPGQTFFVARTDDAAESLLPALRDAIARNSPSATITRIKTLDAQLADSLAREGFQTLVLVAFGAAALLLAMLGIYGVLSYAMTARKQEIGVRMALGATRSNVYRMAMSHSAVPVGLGLGGGLIFSWLGGRLIEKLLYGTRAMDPVVTGAVAAVFLLAAAAAAFLPARRAASVDPVEALRPE